jgi:hypothetical protein
MVVKRQYCIYNQSILDRDAVNLSADSRHSVLSWQVDAQMQLTAVLLPQGIHHQEPALVDLCLQLVELRQEGYFAI